MIGHTEDKNLWLDRPGLIKTKLPLPQFYYLFTVGAVGSLAQVNIKSKSRAIAGVHYCPFNRPKFPGAFVLASIQET